jgi:hypothetical protein
MREERPKPTDKTAGAMSSEETPRPRGRGATIGDKDQDEDKTTEPAPEDVMGVGGNR